MIHPNFKNLDSFNRLKKIPPAPCHSTRQVYTEENDCNEPQSRLHETERKSWPTRKSVRRNKQKRNNKIKRVAMKSETAHTKFGTTTNLQRGCPENESADNVFADEKFFSVCCFLRVSFSVFRQFLCFFRCVAFITV